VYRQAENQALTLGQFH
jgi:hypothetical protein